MENIIILAVFALCIAAAVPVALRHFKGQGGCCGGGNIKAPKKHLSNVLYRKTFTVKGLHCAQCKARVEEAVNDLNGIMGKVNLKRKTLTVFYNQEVEDQILAAAVARVGYTLNRQN